MRTLKRKTPMMKGDDVTLAQQILISAGFLKDYADGKFGEKTFNAVKQYQRAKCLTDDGIIGGGTWAALMADSDNGVGAEFDKLILWGFARTIAEKNDRKWALKQFQCAMSLSPDGIQGKNTNAALDGEVIVPRITEEDASCQCKKYCDGYPVGKITLGVRILAERIFRECEKTYPDSVYLISNREHPTPNDAIAGGTRCDKWNRLRGGASGSQHKKGTALDIWATTNGEFDKNVRQKLEDIAMDMDKYGGVGHSARYIVHIDTRGKRARWKY